MKTTVPITPSHLSNGTRQTTPKQNATKHTHTNSGAHSTYLLEHVREDIPVFHRLAPTLP